MTDSLHSSDRVTVVIHTKQSYGVYTMCHKRDRQADGAWNAGAGAGPIENTDCDRGRLNANLIECQFPCLRALTYGVLAQPARARSQRTSRDVYEAKHARPAAYLPWHSSTPLSLLAMYSTLFPWLGTTSGITACCRWELSRHRRRMLDQARSARHT